MRGVASRLRPDISKMRAIVLPAVVDRTVSCPLQKPPTILGRETDDVLFPWAMHELPFPVLQDTRSRANSSISYRGFFGRRRSG